MVHGVKLLDRTAIYNKYRGQVIAFKQDRNTVIASGRTLKEAVENAKKTGYARPIFSRVPNYPDIPQI